MPLPKPINSKDFKKYALTTGNYIIQKEPFEDNFKYVKVGYFINKQLNEKLYLDIKYKRPTKRYSNNDQMIGYAIFTSDSLIECRKYFLNKYTRAELNVEMAKTKLDAVHMAVASKLSKECLIEQFLKPLWRICGCSEVINNADIDE